MPPHEHDDDAVSSFRPSHVHEPWPYVCASRRSRPRPYVRTWPYFLSCTLAAVRTCTCYVRASTTTRAISYTATVHRCSLQTDRSTSMYVLVRDQNDNATYASTGWVQTVRHFLACEDAAGGSQQSGGNVFFAKYGGPSGGSLLSGGGIIILRVIRRHFLAAAVDPAVSLSTYSPRPMEAVP